MRENGKVTEMPKRKGGGSKGRPINKQPSDVADTNKQTHCHFRAVVAKSKKKIRHRLARAKKEEKKKREA